MSNENKPQDNKPQDNKELKDALDKVANLEKELAAAKKVVPEKSAEKTKTYIVKDITPIERNKKTVQRSPSISEDGGVYTAGMPIELTPTRMKQIGKQFFEEAE